MISLHCPLTADNAQFVNRDLLARVKPTAFLLNTARGGLIDEAALAEALSGRRLAGAAVDVLSSEPPRPDNPLLGRRTASSRRTSPGPACVAPRAHGHHRAQRRSVPGGQSDQRREPVGARKLVAAVLARYMAHPARP